jgi:hypothetical protein
MLLPPLKVKPGSLACACLVSVCLFVVVNLRQLSISGSTDGPCLKVRNECAAEPSRPLSVDLCFVSSCFGPLSCCLASAMQPAFSVDSYLSIGMSNATLLLVLCNISSCTSTTVTGAIAAALALAV